MRWLGLLVGVLALAGRAGAQSPGVVWDSHTGYGYSNSPGKVTVVAAKYEAKSADFGRLLMGRSYQPGGAANHSIVRDLLSKPSNLFGGANPLPGALERQVAVKAVARGAFRMVPIVGTAMMISDAIDLLETSGCKLDLDKASWECPATTSKEMAPSGEYKYGLSGQGKWFLSEGEVVNYLESLWSGNFGAPGFCSFTVKLSPGGDWAGDAKVYSRAYTSFAQWEYVGGVYGCTSKVPPALANVTIVRTTGVVEVNKCEGYYSNKTGQCAKTGTEPDVVDNVPEDDANNATRAPSVMDWMDKNGGQYETGNPKIVDLPGVISGGRVEDTTNPDGSRRTRDRDYILETSPNPSSAPTIIVRERDTVTDWPTGTTPMPAPEPGATNEPPVTVPEGGAQSTTTTSGSTGTMEITTCGLPDTPPCRIDESGTPEADMHDSEDETSGLFAPLWECLSSPTECVPELPDLNWSFSLPNTCAPIPTAGFAPYVEQIDICPFQDTMHELMSMVWAAAGLFAAAGMIIRDSRAGS